MTIMASKFLSTPSARRATRIRLFHCRPCSISIHALREEGDHRMNGYWPNAFDFYPRPPRGGRQYALPKVEAFAQFLSTPSARRATGVALGVDGGAVISIHALREEGDAESYPNWTKQKQFLSTPSARRATKHCLNRFVDFCEFLSTPSARRATKRASATSSWRAYFYPRPPRGGRQLTGLCPFHEDRFLSTPSARRATHKWQYTINSLLVFLSTPSARRATR